MNGKIAPKSIVIGSADLIAERGKQNPMARYGEFSGVLSGLRTAGLFVGNIGSIQREDSAICAK